MSAERDDAARYVVRDTPMPKLTAICISVIAKNSAAIESLRGVDLKSTLAILHEILRRCELTPKLVSVRSVCVCACVCDRYVSIEEARQVVDAGAFTYAHARARLSKPTPPPPRRNCLTIASFSSLFLYEQARVFRNCGHRAIEEFFETHVDEYRGMRGPSSEEGRFRGRIT